MSKLLSVCMIVKDEQDVLDRCLSSIVGLADEIIIVDTGSTDRTKEIALKYTNHVYDFTWTNDFSEARNASLQYATAKWVLVLDADEYIDKQDIPGIKAFLQSQLPESHYIFTVSVFSFQGETVRKATLLEGAVGRLFANHAGIRFVRPIHEQLASRDGQVLPSKVAPISIYHTGYLEDVIAAKKKAERNALIFNQLKHKTGFTAYDHFTIGNQYTAEGDYKKAVYYLEKAYKKSVPTTNWHYMCVFELIFNYLRLDRVSEAWRLLEKECFVKREYPDYYSVKGIIYEHFGLFDLAKKSYKTALQQSEALAEKTNIFWLVNPGLAAEIPLSKLIAISLTERNTQESIYYLTKKIKSDPADYASLLQLCDLMLHFEKKTDQIDKFIELLFPRPRTDQLYLLFKVFTMLGDQRLSAKYYTLLADKQIFSLQDQLRLSLLLKEPSSFASLLPGIQTGSSSPEILPLVAAACLVWEPDLVHNAVQAENKEALEPALQLSRRLMANEAATTEWVEQNQDLLLRLLTSLCILKYWDVFDNYIERLNHPLIINGLANFFYSKYQYNEAVGYYSLLLEANQLSLDSYINLARLHINDHLYDDAVPFLEQAIEESPQSVQLYIQLLLYCTDTDKKQTYRKKLLDRYPHYRNLPFLTELLHN